MLNLHAIVDALKQESDQPEGVDREISQSGFVFLLTVIKLRDRGKGTNN